MQVPHGVRKMNCPKYVFQFLNRTKSQEIECCIMKIVCSLLNIDNNNNYMTKFIVPLVPNVDILTAGVCFTKHCQ
jgi:hypothetical protein